MLSLKSENFLDSIAEIAKTNYCLLVTNCDFDDTNWRRGTVIRGIWLREMAKIRAFSSSSWHCAAAHFLGLLMWNQSENLTASSIIDEAFKNRTQLGTYLFIVNITEYNFVLSLSEVLVQYKQLLRELIPKNFPDRKILFMIAAKLTSEEEKHHKLSENKEILSDVWHFAKDTDRRVAMSYELSEYSDTVYDKFVIVDSILPDVQDLISKLRKDDGNLDSTILISKMMEKIANVADLHVKLDQDEGVMVSLMAAFLSKFFLVKTNSSQKNLLGVGIRNQTMENNKMKLSWFELVVIKSNGYLAWCSANESDELVTLTAEIFFKRQPTGEWKTYHKKSSDSEGKSHGYFCKGIGVQKHWDDQIKEKLAMIRSALPNITETVAQFREKPSDLANIMTEIINASDKHDYQLEKEGALVSLQTSVLSEFFHVKTLENRKNMLAIGGKWSINSEDEALVYPKFTWFKLVVIKKDGQPLCTEKESDESVEYEIWFQKQPINGLWKADVQKLPLTPNQKSMSHGTYCNHLIPFLNIKLMG